MAIENVRFVLASLMILEPFAQGFSLEKFLCKVWQNSMGNICVDGILFRKVSSQMKHFITGVFLQIFEKNILVKHLLVQSLKSKRFDEVISTLLCMMLKNGQAYFKNLAVFTPQDF